MNQQQEKKTLIKKLREEYSDSIFCDPEFDEAIIGCNPSNGSIVYHLYEMIYLEMDLRKDEFNGDYEKEKEEFTQDFQDFYAMIEDGIENTFRDWQDNPGDKVPPTLFLALNELL